jgi:hypothetical protein
MPQPVFTLAIPQAAQVRTRRWKICRPMPRGGAKSGKLVRPKLYDAYADVIHMGPECSIGYGALARWLLRH